MKYLDIHINQVSNGFIVRGSRGREMIEDRVNIPETTFVFDNLDRLCGWLHQECSPSKQEK